MLLPYFCPPKFLQNPHLQTILPRIIPQQVPNYEREYHKDSTNKTFVAYDFVISDPKNRQIAVMFHGLEGSSYSPYAKAFANYAKQLGKNAVIVHYRGCGGMTNTSDSDYHATDIDEIEFVFVNLASRFDEIYAVGVSLGGNALARYLGVYADKSRCQKAVIVSAPVDLLSSSKAMHKLFARHVYTPFLLNPLIKKARQKIDKTQQERLRAIKTLDAFDDFYTAPRHGFGNADNYYKTASALPVLKYITKPTLIISANDDPFLGIVACQDDISPQTSLLYSKHGGHIGFVDYQNNRLDLSYLPRVIFDFF